MKEITSPNKWLKGLTLPEGFPKTQGLDFITNNLIPFLISGALFILFVLSLIFLIIGGIRLIISGGDKEGTAKAKATITSAIIGLVLGLSSFIILGIISRFFCINLLGLNLFGCATVN